MVHSLYGWEDHIHTSPKVGYSHPHPQNKNLPQWTCMGVIDLEAIFEGPGSSRKSRQ